jgi:hypothetical protein
VGERPDPGELLLERVAQNIASLARCQLTVSRVPALMHYVSVHTRKQAIMIVCRGLPALQSARRRLGTTPTHRRDHHPGGAEIHDDTRPNRGQFR